MGWETRWRVREEQLHFQVTYKVERLSPVAYGWLCSNLASAGHVFDSLSVLFTVKPGYFFSAVSCSIHTGPVFLITLATSFTVLFTGIIYACKKRNHMTQKRPTGGRNGSITKMLAALADDLGSSQHHGCIHNCLKLQSQEIQCPPLISLDF